MPEILNTRRFVLVIEDGFWDTQEIIARVTRLDATPVPVASVAEAIAYIEDSRKLDGIILDIVKVGQSGMAFIAWLDANFSDHPPVLVHSRETEADGIALATLNDHPSGRISFHPKALHASDAAEPGQDYVSTFVRALF